MSTYAAGEMGFVSQLVIVLYEVLVYLLTLCYAMLSYPILSATFFCAGDFFAALMIYLEGIYLSIYESILSCAILSYPCA